jgi:hypothetical protein
MNRIISAAAIAALLLGLSACVTIQTAPPSPAPAPEISIIPKPASVEFSVSANGKEFETVATVPNDDSPQTADIVIRDFAARLSSVKARYLEAEKYESKS